MQIKLQFKKDNTNQYYTIPFQIPSTLEGPLEELLEKYIKSVRNAINANEAVDLSKVVGDSSIQTATEAKLRYYTDEELRMRARLFNAVVDADKGTGQTWYRRWDNYHERFNSYGWDWSYD